MTKIGNSMQRRDFIINNSDIMREWNWDKNNELGLKPDKITEGSEKKVWWSCNKCHEWMAMVVERVANHRGCPYCSGHKVWVGFNDLSTTHPDIAKQWHPTKNNNLTPEMVSFGSQRKVWWVCENGHEWEATVGKRTYGGGCPYCPRDHIYKVIEGENDLKTTHPLLCEEWDKQLNGDLQPEQFSKGSHRIVYWRCKICNHVWTSSIKDRAQGHGCPECVKVAKTSFPERALYFYIRKYYNDAVWGNPNSKFKKNSFDIYLPSQNIAIEYDGERFHQNIEKDKSRDKFCCQEGINLIRIREPNCPIYTSTCTFFYLKDAKRKTLQETIVQLLIYLNIEHLDINIQRDYFDIEQLVVHKKVQNSLAMKYPDIAAEWNPIKNGNLTPDSVSYGSSLRIWWICKQCGHEYSAVISSRTSRGRGCPECKKHKLSKERGKPVRCIELNQVFNSIKEAKRQTGVNNISYCCAGKHKYAGKHPITKEPLHWEYC